MKTTPNIAVDLAPFGRWTLREKPRRPLTSTLGLMIRPYAPVWMLLFYVVTSAAQAPLAESDVMVLQKSAEAGDRGVVRTLFGLYPRSDGAVTEDIDMILGNVARHHPRMFLEELKLSNAGRGKCTTLELTDQTDAQVAELRGRRKALLSVTDSPLRELRDDCIRELDQSIRIFANAVQSMKGGQ
ncbi:MAG: hypothetical protein EPO47_07710 [Rugosibacter sp.]|nr:MAG: hypothetical protein EPO60_11475 [Rugosibacter sp.]TBR08845.1 MAG: hypothetical protein EPO47_07710 [Rugosibacter sp.]